MVIKEITIAELREMMRDGETVTVKLHASWCQPCKQFAPVFESVTLQHAAFIEGFSLQIDSEANADDANPFLAECGVRGVPAVLMIKDGEIEAKVAGLMTADQYRSRLNQHLGIDFSGK